MFACAITLVSSRVWCTLSSVHPLQWLCSCVFYSTVVPYHYFKPRISRSNHKSSGDIAGSVQSLSCLTLCNPLDCSTPGFPSITNSQSLLKLMAIESVVPSNHLILFHPLLLLPSVFSSNCLLLVFCSCLHKLVIAFQFPGP